MITSKRRAAHQTGVDAESLAAAALAASGYDILNRRYKTPGGEVDLVARRGGALCFIEVKARRCLDDAAWSISERQQRRIAEAASYWLQNFPDETASEITFDAVFVAPGLPPKHIVDAFRPGF